MAESTDTGTPTVAGWQKPIGLTVAIFVISLVLLLGAFLIRWPVDAGQLLYDLGIGVGVATAISIVVTQHLDKLDQAEKDRREAARRALEQTEERLLDAQAKREHEIKERQEEILRDLRQQGSAMEGLHDDVRQLRSRVDELIRAHLHDRS